MENISRNLTTVTTNTLPDSYHGRWLSDEYRTEFRFKPAFDTTTVMLECSPAYIVKDAETLNELFRFQTATTFSFSGAHSDDFIIKIAHYVTNIAIQEFNNELSQCKSTLAIHRKFEEMAIAEIEPTIKSALKNGFSASSIVTPYWKNNPKNSIEGNEALLNSLPAPPSCKDFTSGGQTEEQKAFVKIMEDGSDKESITTIETCLSFYKNAFKSLKEIDLSSLTDSQLQRLENYMRCVLNVSPVIFNDLEFDVLYRAVEISPDFLEDGKVRSIRYLTYPPVDLIKKRGIYNRASSPENTLFYGSINENVAVREIKAEKGKKIVVSKWALKPNHKLNRFPLMMTAGIRNDFADRSNQAFEYMKETLHPLIAQWMECIFGFFATEFVKESNCTHPKKYEYFFSAYFGDLIFQNFPDGTSYQDFDCLVYPSVAWQHAHDNVAVLPKAIEEHFELISVTEYEIGDTWYDKKISLDSYSAILNTVRTSITINNGRIIWNDD